MALLQYDPHEHINSAAWLALDELERMQLVRRYHRRQRIRLPNETIHAVVHAAPPTRCTKSPILARGAFLLRLKQCPIRDIWGRERVYCGA